MDMIDISEAGDTGAFRMVGLFLTMKLKNTGALVDGRDRGVYKS